MSRNISENVEPCTLAMDTETDLLRPSQMAPELVCLTTQVSGDKPAIFGKESAQARLADAFSGGTNIFVGHNIAYDMAVICEAFPHLMPDVFRAYDEDRVTDTGLREKLFDIASGRYRGYADGKGTWIPFEYSLEAVAKRRAGLRLKKTGFRFFYSFFRGVPVEQWTAHAKTVQGRARAYAEGARDPDFDTAKQILGDDVFAEAVTGLILAAPEEALTYALDDATATLAVYEAQQKHKRYLEDQYRQARADFALYLSSAWGLRTDAEGVERLRTLTQKHYDELFGDLVAEGLLRANGTRDTKAAKRRMIDVCKRDGLTLRRTAGHASEGESKCKALDGTPLPVGHDDCAEHVCLDADACGASDDPVLVDYADLSTTKKVLTNDIENLARGTYLPVHTRYGLADSGRATSSNPPIQNLSKREGIRECFIPRPGKVFAAADFPSLELYTHAQCCFSWLGRSKLGEALNAGLDPHLAMAAQMMAIPYAEASSRYEAGDVDVADMRQLSKIANFGFGGGMGPVKLAASAKKQLREKPELIARLDLSVERMRLLKEQWFATWPEMPHYFARINQLCDTPDGRATVETLFTKRTRGGASYCAACNNGFQALGADCAKSACWNISRALYVELGPLFNSRLVAFVHDEFIVETAEGDKAHDAAYELARLMCLGANVYLPDVNIPTEKIKPLLMRRWSKKAKQTFNERGRLIPWQ